MTFRLLMDEMRLGADAARGEPRLAAMADALDQARTDVEAVVVRWAKQDELPSALADATPFLEAFGHLVVAWLWLDMTRVALRRPRPHGHEGDDIATGKLWACRYFFAVEVPRIKALLSPIDAGEGLFARVPEAVFRSGDS